MSNEPDPMAGLDRILAAARTALGMDVSFISHLDDVTQRFVRVSDGPHTDVDAASFGLFSGLQIPAPEGYCHYVATGQMPARLPDTAAHPIAAELAITTEAGIGSYAGVPLRLPDGRTYGTLCAVSHQARPFSAVDEQVLTVLAVLVANELAGMEEDEAARRQKIAELEAFFPPSAITILTQPIVDLHTGHITGLEALARFPAHPEGPAAVFASADALGLGVELELAAVAAALAQLPQVPAQLYLSVNLSPTAMLDPRLDDLLAGTETDRIVLELTEHVAVDNYPELVARLHQLSSAGVRIAVDDAGSGFASLRHIVDLRPDVIKLDISLVRGIDTDPARRALARAVALFADELGAVLIAEGIETHAQLTTLQALGITHGQGFHLGRPAPLHTHDLPRRRYTGPERRGPARAWSTPTSTPKPTTRSEVAALPSIRSATG